MAETAPIDHYREFHAALTNGRTDIVDRLLMFEAVAVELVRAGSIAAARVSLCSRIEMDAGGQWRLIGDRWSDAKTADVLKRTWRARGFVRGVDRVWREIAIGDGQRGISRLTLDHWIKHELRPRGLLAPSTGPGRPRRGVSKYAAGPSLDASFV
jgi:hypothetical protein